MALGIEQRTSLLWIGLLRLLTGGLFLAAGIRKLREPGGFRGPQLDHALQDWSRSGRTFDFAREWIALYVQPHLGQFALAVTAGEIVAGTSLAVGFASRLGGLIGFLMNVAYYLASRESINLLMGVVNLAVLFSAGGRAVGLDAAMRRRYPRWILG